MSRKHLKIWKQNNSIYIEDNSTNGTYVNGKQIDKFKPVTVKKGDTITLAYGKDAAVLTIIATDGRADDLYLFQADSIIEVRHHRLQPSIIKRSINENV